MTRKCLFVRPFDPNLRSNDYGKFWESALIENGIGRVEFYDFDGLVSQNKIYANKFFYHIIKKTPLSVYKEAEKRFISFLREKDLDFIFFFGGKYVRPILLKRIKRFFPDTVLVNIFHDNPFFYFNVLKSIPIYDYFFVKDRYVLKELSKLGFSNAYFCAQAFSPEYQKVTDVKSLSVKERQRCSADISFIGSIYPQRQKILEVLSGRDMKLWGKSVWDSVDKESRIMSCWQDKMVVLDEKSKVIALSKINLNTHNYQNDIDGTNSRTFEICGCGGFQLVDYKPVLEEHFFLGKEIETFKDAKELKQKVEYYLENEEERNKIAKAGHKRALKEHTYSDRVKTILSVIDRS